MSDTTLLFGQLIGVGGGIVAVLATAVLYWRAGKGVIWCVAIVFAALLFSTLGLIWSAQAAAEGSITVDTYYLFLRFQDWYIPLLLLVLACSPWPNLRRVA